MPLCDLPLPVEMILKGVDACIVTHIHPDHIDMAADGTVGAPLHRDIPVFAQSDEDAGVLRRSGFARVEVLTETSAFGDIRLVKTPGLHGTEKPCGPSCGVVFRHPAEPTLYVAGDTVWYDGVAETLAAHRPDVIVLNACAAELVDYGRLIMDDEDVEKVCRACPEARVIASHMDTVAHATIPGGTCGSVWRGAALRIVCCCPMTAKSASSPAARPDSAAGQASESCSSSRTICSSYPASGSSPGRKACKASMSAKTASTA